jgi:hypothetical protein
VRMCEQFALQWLAGAICLMATLLSSGKMPVGKLRPF